MASASSSGPGHDTIQLPSDRSNIQLRESATAVSLNKTPKIVCAHGEEVELGKKNDGSVKTVVDRASNISFTLVRRVSGGEYGFIKTQYLAGAALRAAAGHASGAAAALAAVAVSPAADAADPSRLLQLNTPPFLIDGDQANAILVMVHTSSPGAQLLNEDGTPGRVYYPNGSELRLVEGRVSGTETGQAGTATSTRLVQIDDDENGNGWLPMGCLLRTTVRNEFDIGGFWTRALAAEAPQNVVNSAGEVLGTVEDARVAYERNQGAGFNFGRYGKDYELFRNEYMPHILRPNDPIVQWVRREGRDGRDGREGRGGNGGTRRRKCKKGKCKKTRASRQLRRRLRTRHRHRR